MPKYTIEDVSRIAEENLNRIRNGVDEWADFLTRAANFYKYSFGEQIVITSLKPNATAVAPFNTWSKQLGARIRSGAEGIPLIRNKDGRKVVTYFYDISDTNSNHKLWQLPKEREFEEELSRAFSDTEVRTVSGTIMSEMAKASLSLAAEIANSNVEFDTNGLDNFLFNSMNLMIYKRCGLEYDYRSSYFEYINSLTDKQLFYIGNALSKCTRRLLTVIEKASIDFNRTTENIAQFEHNNISVQQTISDLEKQQEQENANNIIGNTLYHYIGKKTYRKLENVIALQVAQEFDKAKIKFSGKINDDNTITLTFSRDNLEQAENIIDAIKNTQTSVYRNRFSSDEVEAAKKTNLVGFLASRGEKTKRVGNNEYTMEAHDSMRISDNKFYWNSRGVSGNPVTFCMEYYGMDFKTAVAELLKYNGYNVDIGGNVHYNKLATQTAVQSIQPEETEYKPLPYDLDNKTNRVYAYLTKTRELDGEVVRKFINEGIIAQDIKGNAVFKIFDENGRLSGAEVSGTLTDKRYKQITERRGNGFTINPTGTDKPDKVMFFESAIDALSYYNLHQDTAALLVSMAGLKDKVVLNTLQRYDIDFSNAIISSDNDEAGRNFAEKMKSQYGMTVHQVNDDELYAGHKNDNVKDWNDLLKASEWVFEKSSSAPRRYSIDNNGEVQRAWNGKTADQFDEQDYLKFAADTDVAINNTADSENSAQPEHNFGLEVDKSLRGELPFYTTLKIGDTPQILLDVGCEQLPMLYTQKHLRNAIKPMDNRNHQHGLTIDQIKKIPELLKSPVLIFDSPNRQDSIVALTDEFDSVGNPIVVSIKPNGKGRYEVEEIDANFVTSIYGRNNFLEYFKKIVESDNLLYCSKEKSQALFERWGEQYSELTNNLDLNIIIHQSRNIVNSQQNENLQELPLDNNKTIDNAQSAKYQIYQLKDGEKYHYSRFASYAENQDKNLNIDDYDLVYEGNLSDIQNENTPEGIFVKFNTELPDDFKGHSLSVSDVIVLNLNGNTTAHYVDRIGFKPMPDFLKEKEQELSEYVISNLPDENVSISERDAFGYTSNGIKQPEQTIHLYKLGDFYEAYNDEAVIVAKSLDLTLTSRHVDGNRIPMVGFPQHVLDDYIHKLLENGFATEVFDENNNISFVKDNILDFREEYIADENNIKYLISGNADDKYLYNVQQLTSIDGGKSYSYSGIGRFCETLDEAREYVSSEIALAKIKVGNHIDINFGSKRISGNIIYVGDIEVSVKIDNSYSWDSQVMPKEYIINQLRDNPDNTIITTPYVPQNYKITNNQLGVGTPKEKCRNNIAAINTLKIIESENRTATPEEQEILSKYVGWGGLSDAFDDSKENWSSEYAELKELLSDEEYNSARASTLNAHYTSPEIIGAMYKALSNMGFTSGKILEPAMGIGNFFGMLPDSMQDSKLYGVEIDSISGRIAKQLYPQAKIQVKGFEKTSFTSNSFDVAIGNVPFGNYSIYDNDFKEGNLIHDYFFKKSLDKVRPGGIVAFVTSKGTLDKQDSSVRKYLAERAELLGAIRLPNNAFKANAGTEVTSDIIFLQKREMPIELTAETMPEWVGLAENENGIELNAYFANHPEMVLGEMKEVSGRFGIETACLPFNDRSLSQLLDNAVSNINGSIKGNYAQIEQDLPDTAQTDIIAENYRNYCYAIIDDDIYYREGDEMLKQDLSKDKKERMSGMIGISKALQKLIEYQTEDCSDEQIKAQQDSLNDLYDSFTKKYGLLSDRKNKSLFRIDDTAALLLSLENIDDKGNLISKADIFTKRTIQPYKPVTSVNTASEALAVSISEKAVVDLEYMAGLCSKPVTDIIKDLKGVIYKNPITEKYETAEEYLSGNVRDKLRVARTYAQNDNVYADNITALEQVQPEDLKPEEISVQLGSTWVPVKYFEQFTYELLDTPKRCRSNYQWRSKDNNPFASSGYYADNQTIAVAYDEYTATYGISNKSSYSADKGNVKASQTYGTSRMNAYTIIENTLNGKPVRIMDYYEDAEGKKKAVLNERETFLAQDKQNTIKQKFREWIFADAERTEDICRIYNEKFNSIRPREYDGSHITFGGINPEIKLKKHQTDAIAHTLYGGNTLLAHSVGAGKTFEMVASAMESKRLGLCTKSLICVPKAIVGQTAKEFLQLYPTANILVPDEKDFAKDNRKRFCSRIATGNYDAVIISHNQLEKIPLSAERQIKFIENEIDEITIALEQLKADREGRGFTVKQLEATKKNLENKLNKLNNTEQKDTVITFEELGVDKLYVDEAHFFKNLYFNSKIGNNVAGVNTSSISQRATDLFMKCRYLDEKTGSKGVVFATGTPISNSMTELFTMQNYLQHDELLRRGLNHFDAWASSFGETQLSLELAPEGKGYQMKTRFSKFFNLPELMNMFKEIADIKTADILKLPVPDADFHTIATEPSSYQQDMVDGLAERAKKIRNREVSADVDNMLNVTNDGRKLALDQRLLNELLPDDPNSKVNACVSKVFEIWVETAEQKSTQMIFCDLSTPDKGKFNVYDDVKAKLIAKGIPGNEIAFIHDYPTDEKKQKLFANVRKGSIRVLLGSTGKMGTGTNVQDKLIAAHHLDCPWRPSDLEQRNGRIIRQGNENQKVNIYNYVTKGTFDAYLYQLVENKQKFISQIMTSKSPARSAEDVDESVLSYAQIKALASGNPLIKEKMDLDIEVSRLRTIFAGYQEQMRKMQINITQKYPEQIKELQERIEGYKKDIEAASLTSDREIFTPMTILNATYTDKKEAGEALLAACKTGLTSIGTYRGFDMELSLNKLTNEINLTLHKNMSHTIEIGNDVYGNIARIDNALDGISKRQAVAEFQLENVQKQIADAKESIKEPFPQQAELEAKEKRLEELNKQLTIDDSQTEKSAPENNTPDLTKRSKELSLG